MEDANEERVLTQIDNLLTAIESSGRCILLEPEKDHELTVYSILEVVQIIRKNINLLSH